MKDRDSSKNMKVNMSKKLRVHLRDYQRLESRKILSTSITRPQRKNAEDERKLVDRRRAASCMRAQEMRRPMCFSTARCFV